MSKKKKKTAKEHGIPGVVDGWFGTKRMSEELFCGIQSDLYLVVPKEKNKTA